MSDENKPVSQNRAKKQTVVAQLAENLGKAKGLVFTNYQGLTHKQIEELKKAIKPLDANYEITKNTLLKIALESKHLETGDDKTMEGPTGTLFLYGEVIEPLKKLAKTIKDLNLPTIKFAIIDGKVTTADDVLRLSALPSREVLLTQVVIALKSPISGLHRALNWNLQKLVMTLNAVAATKPAVAAVSQVSAPAPASGPVPEPATETPEPATEAVSEPAVEPTEPMIEAQEETNPPAGGEEKTEGGEN